MRQTIFNILLILLFFNGLTGQNTVLNKFLDDTDVLLKTHVQEGRIAYQDIAKNPLFEQLVNTVGKINLEELDPNEQQAFLINAYNLLVIKGVLENYPVESVLNVNGFFDRKKFQVAGESLTLNQLEKDRLLKEFEDARFHFVLVCGAVGCPPITKFAYRPELLEQQLHQQTTAALNDPQFIRVNNEHGSVEFSQIFDWYIQDFGGSKTKALEFINQYRETLIPADYSISFYSYGWDLNETDTRSGAIEGGDNNANRYVVSKAIGTGQVELKVFNNLYTQQTGSPEQLTDRATFFTTSLSALYGVTDRFNAGFDLRYRRVAYGDADSSPLRVLGSADGITTRQGVTSVGPKIRWAPLRSLPNFSVESAFWLPVGSDLEGNNEEPYIDWDGASWLTQFFNDFDIGSNFSLFTELDVFWEDIGGAEDDLNRFSTPATVIFSYFPGPRTTLYALGNYSPYWQTDFDYFAQAGIGAKYQVTPNFEVELLATSFTNEFLQSINGNAATFNIGFRYTR